MTPWVTKSKKSMCKANSLHLSVRDSSNGVRRMPKRTLFLQRFDVNLRRWSELDRHNKMESISLSLSLSLSVAENEYRYVTILIFVYNMMHTMMIIAARTWWRYMDKWICLFTRSCSEDWITARGQKETDHNIYALEMNNTGLTLS